jgi:topoisomerase IA-like protein
MTEEMITISANDAGWKLIESLRDNNKVLIITLERALEIIDDNVRYEMDDEDELAVKQAKEYLKSIGEGKCQ